MKTSKLKEWFKENLSSSLIILGVILGLVCGFILRAFFNISPLVLTYIGLPGTLLVRAFMLLLVPLIVSSLSTGISSIKFGENKRLVVMSLLLILSLTSMVAVFGVILATTIKPGVSDVNKFKDYNKANTSEAIKQMVTSQEDVFYDVLINLVPNNIVGATLMTHYTAMVPINTQNLSEGYKKVAKNNFEPNLLGLVVISLMLAFALLHLEERAQTIKTLLIETNTIVMEIIESLLKIMPFGMFSWMCVEAIRVKSPEKILVQLIWFSGTFILSLTCIVFIFYPAIYFFILHKNPFKMYYNIIPAMLVAFGSSSSAITLPMTMKCMEEKNKLALPISRFFLPLGMTMHMPGTANYCSMIAIFVAQMHGIHLTFPMLFTLSIYTVMMSMAFPATPSQGGLVFFVTICRLIGIENPLEVLAYFTAIDLLWGRLRTTTNIIGDCIIASIVEKFCHFEQENIEDQELKVTSNQNI